MLKLTVMYFLKETEKDLFEAFLREKSHYTVFCVSLP